MRRSTPTNAPETTAAQISPQSAPVKKVAVSRGERMPREQRREQLIDVATGVFAERSYDATSLEEIAERAGVSRPILYSHFGDKRGLFQAVVERQIKQIERVIAASIAGPGDPRVLLQRGMRAFFQYVREHPDGHAVLTRDGPLHLSDSGLTVMLDGLAVNITRVIAAELRALEIDASAAPIYANALIGIGAHVGRWWRDNPDAPLDLVTQQTSDLVWVGFRGLVDGS